MSQNRTPKSFLELAEIVLQDNKNIPMTPMQIWNYAVDKNNYIDTSFTKGKTPSSTLNALLGQAVIHGKNDFARIGNDGEYRYYINRKEKAPKTSKIIENTAQKVKETIKIDIKEIDLHTVLVKFIKENRHFRAYSKTINEKKSLKTNVGEHEWLHPDIVSVFFPFDNIYENQTINLQNKMSISTVKMFSFELKVKISFGNLRESYFQALSNSSWANEGYLVASVIDEDNNDLMDELNRLNNAFGIGVIKLNIQDPLSSRILFSATYRQDVDWDTINRLTKVNTDFSSFLESVEGDINNKKVNNKSNYDTIL